jgi:hypothetical protein
MFALALKDEKITRSPFAGIKFFPEVTTTRFLSEEELIRLQGVMQPRIGRWSRWRSKRD